MIFGKIEYLNLLPFHIFMKRYLRSSQEAMSFRYKKGVPSKINNEFAARRVDAAFISSIKAQKSHYVNLGIIAKKEVLSVLVLRSSPNSSDHESASSNLLAKLLGLEGKVLIGDKALRHYLKGDSDAIDLAQAWNERYKLPFVFALLCHHDHKDKIQKLARDFKKRAVKIPQYQLHKAAIRTGVAPQNIQHYLTYISYDLDYKAKKGLQKFWHLANKTD